MGNNWKEALSKCFQDNQILVNSIQETRDQFDNFCDCVAEPGLALLKEELEDYKIGAKIKCLKGYSISFETNFAKSSINQFHFTVYLPKNSIQMELKTRIGGRKNKKGIMEVNEYAFMGGMAPSSIMDISPEDFIYEVIQHYRNFIFSSTVSAN